MTSLYFYIAICLTAATAFTIYESTSKGVRINLGSFFIIKKFHNIIFKVRSFKNYPLLICRILIALIITIIIYSPSKFSVPDRKTFAIDPTTKNQDSDSLSQVKKYKPVLYTKTKTIDKFDSELFFLDSYLETVEFDSQVQFLYNSLKPNNKINTVIIPLLSNLQNADIYSKWENIFSCYALQKSNTKLKDFGSEITKYVPLNIVKKEAVTVLLETQNSEPILIGFKENDGTKIIISGIGFGLDWGLAGIDGSLISGIETYINSDLLESANNKQKLEDKPSSDLSLIQNFDFKFLIIIFSVLVLLEVFIYLFGLFPKKKLIIILMFLIPLKLFSGDGGFKFIELDYGSEDTKSSNLFFANLKEELSLRTSIRIDQNFYTKLDINSFKKGVMPEQPFLWILGCKGAFKADEDLVNSFSTFIQRGGIVFSDSCGAGLDIGYSYAMEHIILGVAKQIASSYTQLSFDHPLYKSFFLLRRWPFWGLSVSETSGRTAILASKNNFYSGIIKKDPESLKAGVNTVLYMLSGDYKSDQIHVTHILERLKRREMYK